MTEQEYKEHFMDKNNVRDEHIEYVKVRKDGVCIIKSWYRAFRNGYSAWNGWVEKPCWSVLHPAFKSWVTGDQRKEALEKVEKILKRAKAGNESYISVYMKDGFENL